ncbi:hypothetical protein ACHAWF_001742 [Thalassiosira exigua]
MRYNVFEFGDHTFQQLYGTAMGTSSACIYATIYYCYRKIYVLLAKCTRGALSCTSGSSTTDAVSGMIAETQEPGTASAKT